MTTFFDLRERLTSWFFRRDRDINTGGNLIDTGGGNIIVGTGTVDGVDLTAHVADTDAHHNEAHTVASHSDTTGTGAELNTLTDGSNSDALHTHSAVGSHTIASHSDTTATGAELETLTDGSNADALHDHAVPSHTIASHSDTTATGSELNTLTDGSDASTLHDHDGRYFQESEFSSSPTGSEPIEAGGSGGIELTRLGVGVTPSAADDVFIDEYVRTGQGAVFGSVSSSLHPGQGKILITEGSAPGTPGSGFLVIYAKTDGRLYYKNDGGTEHGPL